jgi:hypothetical protein
MNTPMIGQIVYNKSRNGFSMVKAFDGNKVILSGPCHYYEDAITTIIDYEINVHNLGTMKVVSRLDLPKMFNVFLHPAVNAYRVKGKIREVYSQK